MADPQANSAADRAAATERRVKVAQLYLRRWTQAEIAKSLSVSQATVSRDIAVMKAEWRKEALEAIDEHQARELAELNEMERQAARAYANTQDVRFLTERRQIKARKAKLLGIDAPPRAPVDEQGQTVRGVIVDVGQVAR